MTAPSSDPSDPSDPSGPTASAGLPDDRAPNAEMATRFVHLRLRSEFSISDSIVRLDDAVAAVVLDMGNAVPSHVMLRANASSARTIIVFAVNV